VSRGIVLGSGLRRKQSPISGSMGPRGKGTEGVRPGYGVVVLLVRGMPVGSMGR